jgi:hypothetical protein
MFVHMAVLLEHQLYPYLPQNVQQLNDDLLQYSDDVRWIVILILYANSNIFSHVHRRLFVQFIISKMVMLMQFLATHPIS